MGVIEAFEVPARHPVKAVCSFRRRIAGALAALGLGVLTGCPGESNVNVSASDTAVLTTEEPGVHMLGATGRVSGSAFFVTTPGANVLVDLGMFYPETENLEYSEDQAWTEELNSRLPVDPSEVDAIILTHAHLDHIGRVPVMVSRGYRGPIFSTIQTRNLAEVMFDRRLWNANLGKERFRRGKHSNIAHSRADCPWAERISRPVTFRANRSQLSEQGLRMCKVCRRSEVDEIMSLFQVHDYRKPFEISSSVIAEFYDAKHIPGSASVFLIVRMEKAERTLLFSGDIGSGIDSLQVGEPEVPHGVDLVFAEATYGLQERRIADEPFEEFLDDLARALRDGKLVWIPAFALDRTQKVLHVIRAGQEAGTLPEMIDIKVLSSTAKAVNRVYEQDVNFKPQRVDESLGYGASLLEVPRPAIIISASFLDSMEMFHGSMLELVNSEDVCMMMVGYQDPRSIAGLLRESPGKVRIGGVQAEVKAEVKSYGVFSGHAGGPGVIDYVRRSGPAKAVILKHGRPEGMEKLRSGIEEWIDVPVLIPEQGDVISLLYPDSLIKGPVD